MDCHFSGKVNVNIKNVLAFMLNVNLALKETWSLNCSFTAKLISNFLLLIIANVFSSFTVKPECYQPDPVTLGIVPQRDAEVMKNVLFVVLCNHRHM